MNLYILGFLPGTEGRTRPIEWFLACYSSSPASAQNLKISWIWSMLNLEIPKLLSHLRTCDSIVLTTGYNECRETPSPVPQDPIASPRLWTCLWTTVAEMILTKCDICRLWPPTKESELWYPNFYRLQNISWPAFIACTDSLSHIS